MMMFRDVFYNRVATIGLLVLCVLILHELMPVLVPFIVAFVLAYLLNPIVNWLGKIGISRMFAISLVFFALTVLAIMSIWYIIPLLIDQFEVAKNNMPVFLEWLNNTARPWVSSKIRYDIAPFNSSELSDAFLQYIQANYNVNDAKSIVSTIANSGLSAISSIGLFVLVPVLTFFYMASWERNIQAMQAILPLRMLEKSIILAKECHEVMMTFVKGQMLVMFILGLVYAIGLQLGVGLETGFMIGMVAGLASIVPYLGIAVGVISAVIATIVQFGFDIHLLYVAIVFGVGQLLEGYVLQPFLLGDRIGLSPIMVIFVVLVGGNLMGLVGMLIALPLAAVIMVVMRHIFQSYKNSDFYQRAPVSKSVAVIPTDDIMNEQNKAPNTDDASSKTNVQTDSQENVLSQHQPIWLSRVVLHNKQLKKNNRRKGTSKKNTQSDGEEKN